MPQLPKAYEAKQYEDAVYRAWEASGFFNPDNLRGKPYSIMMPPPNVTGVLHLGHALENTLMDIMARYQRMQGKKVLLLPGTDHAAVATQAKVEKLLVGQGIKNPRAELGRDKLIAKIRTYAEDSKKKILSQIRKMGTSCDWSRLAYTFDDARSKAVNEMFVRMYNDGLIYQGYRVVNWSVKGQSTCSDDELVHIERPAKLYTFRYSKDFPISIATTRPETKLGDTAVAVNPKDIRYKKYIGQSFTVDVGASKPLTITIIADEHVDMTFGTGAVGVTPAHSLVDYDMYEKQKILGKPIDLLQVIGPDGRMTPAAGSFAGLAVADAREKFIAWLRAQNLLEKEEDITQNVGTSDRFGDVVEAIPLTQWFVGVNKTIPQRNKTLKDLMRAAVTTGLDDKKNDLLRITPERFQKTYLQWIDNLRDWCISRQIWWGHRIPVWYKEEKVYCGIMPPEGEGWEQDSDTLDTWFSSGLWTFSTLGWPSLAKASAGKPVKTNDLKTFHPTSWMQMGYEILFFWMARMILMSMYALKEIPFRNAYIHGMVRDEHGKKFSKSAANGIDPIDVIHEFGADALRFSVVSGTTPGNDSRFFEEKIEGARNLVNKIWNISRFMLVNIKNPKPKTYNPKPKTLADRWILSRLAEVTKQVTEHIESFNFSLAGETLRDFTWGDLADWYLEIAKIEGSKDAILNYLLNTILKLWHPFMPFVTEVIWSEIYGTKNILMVEPWPINKKIRVNKKDIQKFGRLQSLVTALRSIRAEYRIDPAKKLTVMVGAGGQTDWLKENSASISGLARLETLAIEKKVAKKPGAVGMVVEGMDVLVDLAGMIDVVKEKDSLAKDIAEVEPYVLSLEKKLGNEQFLAHAPKEVVAKERQKLAEAKEKLDKLQQQLSSLN